MTTGDRRVRRTQRALARALIDLTLEKGYEAVTIRDLTERADVGYATFFRHYHDKDALLEDVLDVVLTELIGLLAPVVPAGDPAAVGVVLFHYVQAHHEVVHVLLRSRALLARVTDVVTARIVAEQRPRPGSLVPPDLAAHHLVAASIALIAWWLDHGQPYSPEHMGVIYQELIAQPTSELAFAP